MLVDRRRRRWRSRHVCVIIVVVLFRNALAALPVRDGLLATYASQVAST